jgi:DNA polymerase
MDASPFVPEDGDIATLTDAARGCQGCPLFAHATQTVFGEGPERAVLMLVGEQPGDQEDRAGHPFVGPAGRLLDRALAEAGIDRTRVYVTNAVKHFKFEERGKRRIHKKPSAGEVRACEPWLRAEVEHVKPRAIVCLGATALQAVVGPQAQLMKQRGQWLESSLADRVLATRHPSALLRMRDDDERAQAFQELVEDLRRAAAAAKPRTHTSKA